MKIITEERFINGKVMEYVTSIKKAMKVKDIRKAIPKEFCYNDIKNYKSLVESVISLLEVFEVRKDLLEEFFVSNKSLEIYNIKSNEVEIKYSLCYKTKEKDIYFGFEIKKDYSITENQLKKLRIFGKLLHQFRVRQKEIEKNLKENIYEI